MSTNTDKIAVVGLAGRFPGANNIDEYWENLVAGRETITRLQDEELEKYEVNFKELKSNPNYVRARGTLQQVDHFDASFFGMTPREASYTDPQQRIWLETAWNALENANIDPFGYKGAIGVYAGSYINTYLLNNILRDPSKLENFIRLRGSESFQLMTGNDVAYIPTKTAYKFNLKGPAINVQTACSTSLVAIIQACQSLFTFESDVCLAGGVCILNPQETGYLYQEGAIPSPDGHCRPFDAKAKGTVFSNGVGIVVLKRLEDALNDKDKIYAVVSGWALNNDGNKKVSYMAPSIDGQAEVIMMAQSFANVSPEDISYIEAHGTATQLGDPIEVAALTKAFSRKTHKKQFCGIGSVKSNIGHTDAAAGVASFIKSCLSVYHQKIPKTLHFEEPNPHIDFANSPFYVQSEMKEWNHEKPMIVGVSSFGIGGTNAHVIIEEPPREAVVKEKSLDYPALLVISAKSENSLEKRKELLKQYLTNHPETNLADLSFTLQQGRNHMPYRSFITLKSISSFDGENAVFSDGKTDDSQKKLTFVFPGQGAQYVQMGKELYESVPIFRNLLDQCFNIFRNTTGEDLQPILFAIGNPEESEKLLAQTRYTQPALFIIEYALAKTYLELGFKPDYLIGHSIGEYAAAALSGVFDMETALKIVIKRGELMQGMPAGQMLAVRCDRETLLGFQSDLFEIAAENTRSASTISLTFENLEAVKTLLEANNISYVALNTSHAFHSSAFDPIIDAFAKYVDQFQAGKITIPFISCLTGDFIRESDACTGIYWAKQLRNTVMFDKGISSIAQQGDSLFLETGPNTHLSSFIKTNKAVVLKTGVISTLGKPGQTSPEVVRFMDTIGNLWANGCSVDFNKIYDHHGSMKISLPGYPFDRSRYWIDHAPSDVTYVAQKSNPEEQVVIGESSQKNSPGLKQVIIELLSDLSGYSKNDLKDNVRFVDMGFDSLFLAQFARAIESKFKVSILFRQLAYEYSDIEKLSEYIGSNTRQNVKPSSGEVVNLMYLNRTGSKTPFIIVHGGNAANFLPPYFQGDRKVLNFSDLGSDGEKITIPNIEELAYFYVKQIKALLPNGPYILCGFSFGGLVASKIATILTTEYHDEIPGMIFFDTQTPQAELPKGPGRLEKLKNRRDENIVVFVLKSLQRKIKWLIRWIKKRKYFMIYIWLKIPVPVHMRSKYIFSVYMRMTQGYVPEKVNSELMIFKSNVNPIEDDKLGWEGLVNNIETYHLEGDHLEIIQLENNFKFIGEKILAFVRRLEKK